MNLTATTRVMPDAERRERHARSMKLYEWSIGMYSTASVLGIIGIAFWPAWMIAIGLIVVSRFVSRHAEKVSPYGDCK